MYRNIVLVLLAYFLTSCGQPLVTATPQGTRLSTPSSLASPSVVALSPRALASPAPEVSVLSPTAVLPIQSTPLPASDLMSVPSVTVVPQVPSLLTNEQRWRMQQRDRVVFDVPRLYDAHDRASLYWYDPVSGQTLEVGALLGEFVAQAQFKRRDDDRFALEIPYRINHDFGLTSISDAVRQRMQSAGYTESVEAYVLVSDVIEPR